jgi:exodeoxyribonuclease-3
VLQIIDHLALVLADPTALLLRADLLGILLYCSGALIPAAMAADALMQPESRDAYARLLGDGWTDALDTLNPRGGVWTFWDYQAGAWQRDHGFRIDHLLLSPQAADKLAEVKIHRDERDKEKPSDHVPVVATLAL